MQTNRMSRKLWFGLAVALLLLASLAVAAPTNALVQDKEARIQALAERMLRGEAVTPAEKELAYPYYLAMLREQPVNPPVIDRMWGPDSFGYSARDINDGATYSWEDITTSGTEIWATENQDDTFLDNLPIGFTFNFYGQAYTTFSVSANCFLRFDINDWVPYYGELPANHYQIAPFKFDQYHLPTSHYYYQTLTNPNRLVVSFYDVRYYNGTYRNDSAYTKTMQIVLYESGVIKFNYQRFGTIAANQPTLPYVAGIDDNGPSGMNVYSDSVFTSGLTNYAIEFFTLGPASNPIPGNGMTGVPLNASLSWSAAPGALGYDVLFGTANPPVTVVSNNQTATTYTPTLAASTTYYWQIVSRGPGGTTMNGPVWTFQTGTGLSPNAPSNGSVSSPTTTSLQVNWTDNATDETGFPIHRSTGAGGFALIATAEANATSYVNTGLTPAERYFYRIYASNTSGTSLQYASGNGWTLPNPAGMLTLGMAGAGHTTIQIVSIADDGNSANATYKILETTTNSFVQTDGMLGATPAVRARDSWAGSVVSGLASGQSYSFRAIAMNGVGNEAQGPISSITTNNIHVGGPDAFGYRYKDSEAVGGPTFSWITPSPNATTVTGWTSTDDGYAGPYDLGFSYSWYGTTYTQWMAGTNGRIQFGNVGNASNYWVAGPYIGFPGGVYFWNYDMSVSATTVQFENMTGPNRLVITYTNLRYLGGTFGIDAQLIIYQTGDVVVQFGPQTGTPAFNWSGIQNDQGSIYLSYPMLPTPNLAIRYSLGSALITANVRNAQSAPIPGVNVQLLTATGINAEEQSNAQGVVNFTSVPADIYRLRAFAEGYQILTTDTFSVHDNDTITRTLTMQVQSANLNPPQNLVAVTGQVASVPLHWAPPATGTGTVIGYRVYRIYGDTTMVSYRPNPTDTTYTDDGLMNGVRYQYYVTALYNEGFSGPSNTAWAYPRPDNTMQFGNMHGRITNIETGAGLRGEVEILTLRRTADTDSLGYYSFVNIPVGNYRVVASSVSWRNDSANVAITQDIELTQNFVLSSIGNAAPALLRHDNDYDDRVVLRWNAPGDNRISSSWEKDTGVMTNAFYNINGDSAWNVTKFTVSENLPWRVSEMMVYFLHEGDPYWPWPNNVMQPMQYGIMLNDSATNRPILPPIWTGIAEPDSMAWRTIPVAMGSQYGDFWLGVRSTTQGTGGQGNTDGIGMDAAVDYLGQNLRQTTTDWEVTDYGGWGDYMMRAVGFYSGAGDNDQVIIPFGTNRSETDMPNYSMAIPPAAKVASTLPLGFHQRNVNRFAPRVVYLNLDSRRDEGENPPSIDWLNGYRIYRNNTYVASVDSTTLTYTDIRGSQFENIDAVYHVTATYTTAPTESGTSNRDTVRFNMTPSEPTDLAAASDSVSHIILTWTAPTTNVDGTPLVDLAGYDIYRNDSLIGTSTTATYTDTPPQLRTAYTYKVSARDEVPNRSAFSGAVTRSVQNYWAPADFVWFPTENLTNGPVGDDTYQTVPIGFPFTFYGNTFENVVISTNGFITFDNTTFAPYWSPGIPNTAPANNLVCAVQADLFAQNAGQVKYYNSGGRFIYSCENIRFLNGVDSAGSFQIVLEPTGAVTISYLRGPHGSSNPLQYAAGVENNDGTVGVQLYYNGTLTPGYTGALDGTAVGFWAGPQTMGHATGYVYRRGGAPVEGASVSVFGNWNDTTDVNGRWDLDIPARSWPINIWKDCLLPRIVHTDSVPGNDTLRFVDTLYQARATTDVTSLEFQVPAGETRSQTIILSNPGDYAMQFETRVQYNTADNLMSAPGDNVKIWQRVETPVVSRSHSVKASTPTTPFTGFTVDQKAESEAWERTHRATPPSTDQVWGPDGFGYNAADNTEGSFPSWLSYFDIRSVGTQILSGDDNFQNFSMDGFTLNYYGAAYTNVFVSTNGYIEFDAVGAHWLSGTIPNTNIPGIVAAHWRDLVTNVTKYYDQAANRYIYQWDGRYYSGNTDSLHFQIQLHGINNAIVMFYSAMQTGGTATAGIQGGDGSNNRYLACYNTAAPTAGWANYGLSFTGPNGSWQRWALLDPASGIVQPNTSAELFLQVTMPDTTPAGSVFSAQIRITTNACTTLVIPFTSTVVSAPENVAGVPQAYKLHQNYPNPFNPTTEIRFDLKTAGLTKMTIYNTLGQEVGKVVNEYLPAGYHSVRFDAKALSAGVYFYRIESGNFTSMKKMVLVK